MIVIFETLDAVNISDDKMGGMPGISDRFLGRGEAEAIVKVGL
jgi:hypothetical protein